MKVYEFDLFLQGVAEITDEQADLLYAQGCDDATPASCDGVAWLHFDREATSLEAAIASAVTQVQATGLKATKVELDAAVACATAAT